MVEITPVLLNCYNNFFFFNFRMSGYQIPLGKKLLSGVKIPPCIVKVKLTLCSKKYKHLLPKHNMRTKLPYPCSKMNQVLEDVNTLLCVLKQNWRPANKISYKWKTYHRILVSKNGGTPYMIDMSLFDKQFDIIHGDQQKYIK